MKYSLYSLYVTLFYQLMFTDLKKKKSLLHGSQFLFTINSTITAITGYFNPETFLSKSMEFLACKDVKYLETCYLVSPWWRHGNLKHYYAGSALLSAESYLALQLT